MRKILAFLLFLLIPLSATLTASGAEKKDAGEEFEPVLRFVACSDTHRRLFR